MKIKGILINNQAKIIEIENSLEEYYRELNCNNIEVVKIEIDDKIYSVLCNDEELLKEETSPSAMTFEGENLFYGKVFIANHDSEGNLISLTNDDIDNITGNFMSYWNDENIECCILLCELQK